MIADAETYDEIKWFALNYLKIEKCTSCGILQPLWAWHFLCPSCARALGYDQWAEDKYCVEIADLLAGRIHKVCADRRTEPMVEAWLNANGCHDPKWNTTIHWNGVVIIENRQVGERRVYTLHDPAQPRDYTSPTCAYNYCFNCVSDDPAFCVAS